MLDVGRIRAFVAATTDSARRTWLTTFFVTFAVYAFTAHWQVGQAPDGIAAAWPAYALRVHGSLFLDGLHAPNLFGLGFAHHHAVALRTPGIVLAGLPVQLLVGWVGLDAEQGGALTAALVTAAALANVAVLLRRLVARDLVVPVTAALAFGTSAWTVASAELWTHGPDLLYLSTALLLLVREQHVLAGMVASAAVLTRPHLAVVVAVLGIASAWSARRWQRLLSYGVPAVAALGLTVAWNAWYLGEPHLLAGAYTGQSVRITGGPGADFSPSLGMNVLGTLFSPGVGLFLFSPFTVVAALCLWRGLREAPSWACWALLGGLGYFLVQSKLNYFNGGGGFYGYRLALEPLFLAVPVAAVGYDRLRHERRWLPVAAQVTTYASVAVYGIGALLATYWFGSGTKDWDVWYPWHVVRSAGTATIPVAVVVLSTLLFVRATSRTDVRAPTSA